MTDTASRIARVYGYAVCLAAILVVLASVSSIVGSLYDRANPLASSGYAGDALTSFEAFKATHGNLNRAADKNTPGPDTLTDAALRQQYEARVADRLADVRYRTGKNIATALTMVLLSVGLFAAHWWWLRRLQSQAAAP